MSAQLLEKNNGLLTWDELNLIFVRLGASKAATDQFMAAHPPSQVGPPYERGSDLYQQFSGLCDTYYRLLDQLVEHAKVIYNNSRNGK